MDSRKGQTRNARTSHLIIPGSSKSQIKSVWSIKIDYTLCARLKDLADDEKFNLLVRRLVDFEGYELNTYGTVGRAVAVAAILIGNREFRSRRFTIETREIEPPF